MRLRSLSVVVVIGCFVIVALWSCGGAGTQGTVAPLGGEVCLTEGEVQKVCIELPENAVDEPVVIRITPSNDAPGGAYSQSYDIVVDGKASFTFLKPAKVRMHYEEEDTVMLANPGILRVYTIEPGTTEWASLGNSGIDRVRHFITGDTAHLSPFVLLRADRLPDGGMIMEGDASVPDSGGNVIPRVDGGSGKPDAAVPFDAGTPDAGTPDSGTPDGGASPSDAGQPDAGQPDAAVSFDAGTSDAGAVDSGTPDAGMPDAGEPDAGTPDAGEPDASVATDAGDDAGVEDAGQPEDAG